MRAAGVVAVTLLLAACQPSGGPAADGTPPESVATTVDRRGAPSTGVPQNLTDLVARGDETAVTWQDEPTLAEIAVTLDTDGRWESARLLYLAAEADRYLSLQLSPDGLAEQRPLLESTLQLQPVPAAGLEQVPPLPDGTLDPLPLAEAAADALAACGVEGAVVDVLYASGAPFSWDAGTQTWRAVPEWTATLTDDAGFGVAVDPVSGAPDDDDACLET